MTHIQNTTELPPALATDRRQHKLTSGITLSYYVGGVDDGTPLVLVHSVNAAPSAIEMKPLFDHYIHSRQVLAPELPGFGSSERPDISYSPEFYGEALREWMTATVPGGADVVALSLSSEFVARTALAAPELFRSLTLISPTGLSHRQPPSETSSQRIKRILSGRLIGPNLFRLLTTGPSIRFFLNKAFVGKTPQELIDYAYLTSHRPGASNAAFSFLSLGLFTRNAFDSLYTALQHPVMVLYDTDPNVSFERLDEIVASQENWQAQRIAPSRGMPHFDHTEQVVETLDRFWAAIKTPQ